LLRSCFTYVHELANGFVDEDNVCLDLCNFVGESLDLLLHKLLLLADVEDGFCLVQFDEIFFAYLDHDLVKFSRLRLDEELTPNVYSSIKSF
jgi:hypothetical protein